jgi:hypothetical protein
MVGTKDRWSLIEGDSQLRYWAASHHNRSSSGLVRCIYIEHVARNMAKTARMVSCIMIRNIVKGEYGMSLFSVFSEMERHCKYDNGSSRCSCQRR